MCVRIYLSMRTIWLICIKYTKNIVQYAMDGTPCSYFVISLVVNTNMTPLQTFDVDETFIEFNVKPWIFLYL
jgi:hypothetical protein